MGVRVIGGAFVGALIVFVWGMLFWTVLPFGKAAIKPVPDEPQLASALKVHVRESGAYALPMQKHEAGMSAEDKRVAADIWKGTHRVGPVALVFCRIEGIDPEDPIVFVRGFLIAFLCAVILSGLSSSAAGLGVGYTKRVGLIVGIVIFGAFASHGMHWNWFFLPTAYSATVFGDMAVGWTLAGLAIAAIAKPVKSKAASE
ncbi:MAG: hypothetical protein KIS87_00375 [Phycisphaeraceae bacterium]|nr:hypothetical protein [Phycisphaeraceae bacterium]